jgi:hypothetical protein
MNNRLIQIIREEIGRYGGYTPDWQTDEPSMADKYYEKMLATQSAAPKTPETEVNAEKIGYVTKMWTKQLEVPIPIYKNPKNLQGFAPFARGVLLNNGDFYLATTDNAMHENMLEMLGQKGIIPSEKIYHYYSEFPEEFIAVQRASVANKFVPSTAYQYFPDVYEEIFYNANKKYPYKFMSFNKTNEQTQSPLDPNWMMSNIPQGYDAKILYEKR